MNSFQETQNYCNSVSRSTSDTGMRLCVCVWCGVYVWFGALPYEHDGVVV